MKSPIAGTGTQQANASTSASAAEAVKKSINSELWQACAGPLVNLPAAGTHVVYFPQGHSEQVAASMKKDVNAQIPNYPNLPSKLLCLLHNVTLHADPETDEVYAQMTLQPVSAFDKDGLVRSDLSIKVHKPPPEFFCKTLTASDTSTHGGFSVPRRAAERIFPPLDFTMQPPAQELVARDLHDNVWNFRHIYRGQPKRHLLTSGWSLFVSGKKLFAGDSVLFIRDERQQLLLGVRRANRQPTNLSSSVLSSDSMHIGILAAAAHATANNSAFSVFYNPRASPSEFVIPLAKYYKAACSNQISLGMRFRMMFETEESGTRRCMGTITGISDLDPVRWKNSQWRNLQVGWDEATAGEKRNRVSIWDIEPITAPFFIFPTTPLFHSKRPRQPEMSDNDLSDLDNIFRRTMPWIGDEYGLNDPQAQPGLSVVQWMNTQQNPPLANSMQPNFMGSDISRQLGLSAAQTPPQPNMQFNSQRPSQQTQQWDQLPKLQSSLTNHLGSAVPTSLGPAQIMPSPSSSAIPAHDHVFQQPQSLISHHQLQNPTTFNSNQLQFHDNQKPQLLEIPPTLIPSTSALSVMIPPSEVLSQQATRNNGCNNIQFAQQTGHVVPASPNPIGNRQFSAATAGGVSSAVTDDVPSCSTSPSTNYCPNNVLSTMNSRNQHAAVSLSNPCGLESVPSNGGLMNDLQRKAVDVRPTMNVSHNLGSGIVGLEAYLTANGAHMDYLDSSSSATSVLSQNEAQMPPAHNSVSLNSQSMFFREVGLDIEVQGETRNNGQPEMPMNVAGTFKEVQTSNMLLSGGDMFSCYKNQDVEAELSTSVVSQSFGVPNMPINSIDSSMNDRGLVSWGTWDPPHQLPPMRTYTKVYKRGAVGRSIDITHYSGYDELKQDLSRRFGIEGQLEDRQRVGWKLVYVDHESDVLLVGDDPWEEFVNCVRCIKILSPQEVEHMSLDGDVGNNAATANQACSSSMS